MTRQARHNPTRAARAARRRGSVYLLVLGTAMLVTLMGTSAILLVRVERRLDQNFQDTARARLLASSAVELAMQQLASDPTWRYTAAHDAWSPDATLGGGTLSYKLLDPVDADLDDAMDDPVLVIGRGAVGEAVRYCRVELQPAGSMVVANMLSNPGFEPDTSGWFEYPGTAYADIQTTNNDPHTGSYALRIHSRTHEYAGPGQVVTGLLNGVPYEATTWVRLRDSAEDVRLALVVRSTGDGTMRFSFTSAAQMGVWTQLSGTLTPTWTGDLEEAVFVVETTSSTQEFYIDDVVLVPRSSSALSPRPVTWSAAAP